jgi:hypothetical protein
MSFEVREKNILKSFNYKNRFSYNSNVISSNFIVRSVKYLIFGGIIDRLPPDFQFT